MATSGQHKLPGGKAGRCRTGEVWKREGERNSILIRGLPPTGFGMVLNGFDPSSRGLVEQGGLPFCWDLSFRDLVYLGF